MGGQVGCQVFASEPAPIKCEVAQHTFKPSFTICPSSSLLHQPLLTKLVVGVPVQSSKADFQKANAEFSSRVSCVIIGIANELYT